MRRTVAVALAGLVCIVEHGCDDSLGFVIFKTPRVETRQSEARRGRVQRYNQNRVCVTKTASHRFKSHRLLLVRLPQLSIMHA